MIILIKIEPFMIKIVPFMIKIVLVYDFYDFMTCIHVIFPHVLGLFLLLDPHTCP